MTLPAVAAELTGKGVMATKIPRIQEFLKTSLVTYHRLATVNVGARRATLNDMESPLTTFVTDWRGNLLIETIKIFSKKEIDSGIIILRYPDPICGQLYNEWYVTEKEWTEKYVGNPGEEWGDYKAKKGVTREGLEITPEIIALLGGKDGRAEIRPSWGGTMWALEGGLLIENGSAIAPRILARYFNKEWKVSDRSN